MDIEENKLILSNESKRHYLTKLIGKFIKILYLIEEEKDTGISPKCYIYGLLIELSSANQLFDNELIEIIVKLNIIYQGIGVIDFDLIKKQVFEIKNKILYLHSSL